MKILAVALASESERFTSGYPPKGAWLLRRPDIEIARLANLAAGDDFVYLDERVESVNPKAKFDLILARVQFNQNESARWLVEKFDQFHQPVVLFGPQVTAWGTNAPHWAKHRVKGDITLVWEKIRADAETQGLKPLYEAPPQPTYVVPRTNIGKRTLLNTSYQTIQFIRGCACPPPYRHLCSEYLYCATSVLKRTKEEILGEVISLPEKHIHLLDEDVARFPEYYSEMFRLLWNYRRHWTINAGDAIFNYPELIRLLAKAGTKIIFLNESFLGPRLNPALKDERMVKWLYRRVKFLQARRLLVGAKLTLPVTIGNFSRIATVLSHIDLDFIETKFTQPDPAGQHQIIPTIYHPMLHPDDPAWIKNRFYALDMLIDRFFRRPRRVGFYSTIWYLIPYSLAYRQNFLEGLP